MRKVVAAALVHYRNRPSLGFSDCLVLEIARKAGHVPMGTFDRTLAKLERGRAHRRMNGGGWTAH